MTSAPPTTGARARRRDPGAARHRGRRWRSPSPAHEVRLGLRRGEALLITYVIPVGVLLVFSAFGPIGAAAGEDPVNDLLPGAISLAVIGAAFVALAIATGFERQYGVIKRLGGSPAGTSVVVAAKSASVVLVELVQLVLLVGIATVVLGWSAGPTASAPVTLAALVLGTVAFAGLGLLLAGTLRAEATLALANLLFLVFLVLGGIVVPLDRLPDAVEAVAGVLPPAALTEALAIGLGHAARRRGTGARAAGGLGRRSSWCSRPGGSAGTEPRRAAATGHAGFAHDGPMTDAYADLAAQLAEVGRAAVGRGLVVASGGNLSARCPDRDAFLVTGAGTWLDRLTGDDFALVGLDGDARRRAGAVQRVAAAPGDLPRPARRPGGRPPPPADRGRPRRARLPGPRAHPRPRDVPPAHRTHPLLPERLGRARRRVGRGVARRATSSSSPTTAARPSATRSRWPGAGRSTSRRRP